MPKLPVSNQNKVSQAACTAQFIMAIRQDNCNSNRQNPEPKSSFFMGLHLKENCLAFGVGIAFALGFHAALGGNSPNRQVQMPYDSCIPVVIASVSSADTSPDSYH
jgi:hypothetical protein